MQPWALVTPASRGIGLELARRLLQTTSVPVVATARKDLDQAKENILSGLKDVKEDRLHIVKLDFLGELYQSVELPHRNRMLTHSLRRANSRRCSSTSLQRPRQEILIPPPLNEHSRNPLPRKGSLADRL